MDAARLNLLHTLIPQELTARSKPIGDKLYVRLTPKRYAIFRVANDGYGGYHDMDMLVVFVHHIDCQGPVGHINLAFRDELSANRYSLNSVRWSSPVSAQDLSNFRQAVRDFLSFYQ